MEIYYIMVFIGTAVFFYSIEVWSVGDLHRLSLSRTVNEIKSMKILCLLRIYSHSKANKTNRITYNE